MISDALSYPKSGDGWRSVITGGLLSMFGILLLPAFVVWGYYIRVFREAALGEDVAPRFEDWGTLLGDGFKAFVVLVVYALVPQVITMVILFGVIFSGGGETGSSGLFLLLGLIALVGGVCSLVMVYLIPAAMTNFALTDRLGGAFELRKIASAAFTGEYVLATILAMALRFAVITALYIVFFIVGAVVHIAFISSLIGLSESGSGDPALILGLLFAMLLGILFFFVGFVLFSIALFYVDVVAAYLLGESCGSTLTEASRPDRSVSDDQDVRSKTDREP